MNLLEKGLWWLVKTFPGRYRIIGTQDTPYLGRFYVKHNGILPGVYLHYFYRGDEDRDLHNHPWSWAVSLILTEGYKEERFEDVGDDLEIKVYDRSAPSLNFIYGSTFHRVSLRGPGHGPWTLFISGKDVRKWGFKIRETGEFVHHKAYLGLQQDFVDVAPNRVDA